MEERRAKVVLGPGHLSWKGLDSSVSITLHASPWRRVPCAPAVSEALRGNKRRASGNMSGSAIAPIQPLL